MFQGCRVGACVLLQHTPVQASPVLWLLPQQWWPPRPAGLTAGTGLIRLFVVASDMKRLQYGGRCRVASMGFVGVRTARVIDTVLPMRCLLAPAKGALARRWWLASQGRRHFPPSSPQHPILPHPRSFRVSCDKHSDDQCQCAGTSRPSTDTRCCSC